MFFLPSLFASGYHCVHALSWRICFSTPYRDDCHRNKSSPFPPTSAPNQLPLERTLNATLPLPTPPPLPPPIHELKAAVTAAKSSCGTRIHTRAAGVFGGCLLSALSILSMSIGIEVPDRPRNCERAEVRKLRVVMLSRGG